jgi:arsenate reductase (thioredoxin)
MGIVLSLLWLISAGQGNVDEVGLFTKSLWLVQHHGVAEQSVPESDQRLKGSLALGLAADRRLSWGEIEGWLDRDRFQRIAGEDGLISEEELNSVIAELKIDSRARMHDPLREYCDQLTTSYDMVHPGHYAAIKQISEWIVVNSSEGKPVQLIATCTGNSRRSILNATMGNLAAAYYGLENVHFYSGGTKPSAFNKRTIATLREIGFEIEPTGSEAPRGDPATPNPLYQVRWGKGMQSIEFSKTYHDASNPQTGFAAVLVCSEADAECPTVPGATLRLSMNFIDPKHYDDSRWEAIKYAERRDDIARTWMAVMADASRKIRSSANR